MKRVSKLLIAAGLAWVTCLGINNVSAQDNATSNSADNNNASSSNGGDRTARRGRFNGDPSQFKQMRLDRYREDLEIKDDAEWSAIKPMIEKVMDAQQAVISDRIRGFMGGLGGTRGGGDSNAGDRGNRRGGGGFGGFGGEPSAEATDLQKAIESKAANSELKAALAKLVQDRKDKQTAMDTAQANLRKVLSVRQEAIATLVGLL
jgi:hypothetical protein